ncbi:MAG: hypothetical protein L0227_05995 [Chloroflexi bacterium]|nr:hypothetical protein [Chloroflexota bacterium]
MTSPPNALVAIDAGAATTAVALLGRPAGRWRLAGSLAAPAGVDEGEILDVLAARVRAADPALADAIGLRPGDLEALPRLTSRSAPPRTLVAIGASRRSAAILESIAARTAWRVVTASTETHDPREMTKLALRADVSAVLLSAGDPPGPDERASLDDLAGLVAAAARRRPELQVVLGSAIRERRAWVEGLGQDPPGDPGRIVDGPATGQRRHADERLRAVLDGLLADPRDGRQGLRAVAGSLADLLDRRIEIVEIGYDGGARVVAAPGAPGEEPTIAAVTTARGALVPPEPGDALVDQVLAWTTGSLDRHRMGDRLFDLRTAPWSDATGDGARLRLSAARAAMIRVAAVTPELGALPAPDLTILAGGCFAAAPAAAIMLAAADTIRRTGATQLAADPARLLGPIATIEDPLERRALLADLAGDLLVPLGSLVLAAGLGGRRDDGNVGRLTLEHDGTTDDHRLIAGELAFLDLTPGATATATLELREAARLGRRTRQVSVAVGGGIGGLLVDLRDIPLRLPDRRDRRRSVLAAWSALAWPVDDR